MGNFGGQPAPGCRPSADGHTCGHTWLSVLTCPHHLSLSHHSWGQGSGVTTSATTDVHKDITLTWFLAAAAAVRHPPFPGLSPSTPCPHCLPGDSVPLSQPPPRACPPARPVQHRCPPRGLRRPGRGFAGPADPWRRLPRILWTAVTPSPHPVFSIRYYAQLKWLSW